MRVWVWVLENATPGREKHRVPFRSRESDVAASRVSRACAERRPAPRRTEGPAPAGQPARRDGILAATEARALFARDSRGPLAKAGLPGQGHSFPMEKQTSVSLETGEDLILHLLMQGEVSLLKMSTTISAHFGLDKGFSHVRARATLGDFETNHLAGESFERGKKKFEVEICELNMYMPQNVEEKCPSVKERGNDAKADASGGSRRP